MSFYQYVCPSFNRILGLYLLIFMISCGDSISPQDLKYQKNKTVHIDSVCQTLDILEGEERREFLRSFHSRLIQKVSLDSSEKLLRYEEKYLEIHADKHLLLDNQLQKIQILLVKNLLDSASKGLKTIKSQFPELDYHEKQQFHGLWATLHYYNLQYVKSKKYYQLILDESVNEKDSIYQFFALTNLGALAFAEKQYFEALSYFKRAYVIDLQIGMDNKLLVGNIAACYLINGNYEDAFLLLNKQNDILNLENNTYEGILLKLNYVLALQGLGEWQKSQVYIDCLKENEVPSDLKNQWFTVVLHQYAHTNPTLMEPFSRSHIRLINNNAYNLFSRNADVIYRAKIDTLFLELAKIFNVNALSIDTISSEKAYMSVYYWNKIQLRLSDLGRPTSESREVYFKNALEGMKAYSEQISKRQINGMSAEIQLLQSDFQLANSVNLNQIQALKVKNRTTLLGFLLITLVFIVVLGFLYRKETNLKIKISEVEIDNISKESQLLKQEVAYNKQMNVMSAAILDKSRDMAQALKSYQLDNEGFTKVIRELEQVGLLKASFKSSPEKRILDKERVSVLEKYPVLIELQDTEMRVFILGNQGIKPKDIALTLGISYAYVRNIRSKLKKMLGLASNHSLEGLL